jgi:hypothetical protein
VLHNKNGKPVIGTGVFVCRGQSAQKEPTAPYHKRSRSKEAQFTGAEKR